MDEPTNDLDIETLELLEEQLTNYQGTVLMVSHDRAFLDNVVTSILIMQGDGSVQEYIGGYSDWLKTQRPASPARTKRTQSKSRTPAAFGFKQNRELNALPKKIEKLEAELEALHQKMAAPDYFRTPPAELAADREAETILDSDIQSAYERWETLEQLRDQK